MKKRNKEKEEAKKKKKKKFTTAIRWITKKKIKIIKVWRNGAKDGLEKVKAEIFKDTCIWLEQVKWKEKIDLNKLE